MFMASRKEEPLPSQAPLHGEGTARNIIMQETARPASIIAPGQVVADIMARTFVSKEQAARRFGLSLEELESFYAGVLPVTKELSFKLKEATGFTASHWMGFERFYRRRLQKWLEELKKQSGDANQDKE